MAFALLDKIRLKLFLVFACLATLLLIIGNGMPNWSHGYVTVGSLIGNKVVPANWSPWTVCFTEPGQARVCKTMANNLHLGQNVNIVVSANSGWSSVEAARAFTLLSLLAGSFASIFAAASFFITLSLRQELYITTMAFIASFCGFVSMCVWAVYANTDLVEYGSSFSLVVFSWMLYLIAGIVGNWERFDGVPETGKRFISLGVSFLVFLGTVVAVSLPNWLHQQVVTAAPGPVPISIVYKATCGLFGICFTFTKDGIRQFTQCQKYATSITIPIQIAATTNYTVITPSTSITEVQASAAFTILALLTALVAFVAVAVGFWRRDDTGKFARLRVPLMGLVVFWMFLATILWADLFRRDRSEDCEYGGGFAVNILVWVIALMWIVGVYSKGGPPAASTAGAGFGYVVTTGDAGAYQDPDKF